MCLDSICSQHHHHQCISAKRFWNNLYHLVEPFSGKPAIDPTEEMKKQNYTVRKMFQVLIDENKDLKFWGHSVCIKANVYVQTGMANLIYNYGFLCVVVMNSKQKP